MSFHIAQMLGVSYFYFYHPLHFAPIFTGSFIIEVVASGIFLGLTSFIFIEIMEFFNDISKYLKFWSPLKGLIGGLALTVLTLIFTDQYLGLGLDTITNALIW